MPTAVNEVTISQAPKQDGAQIEKLAKALAKYRISLPQHIPSGSHKAIVACPECSPLRKNPAVPSLEVWLGEGEWVCHHCGFLGSVAKGPGRRKGPFEWIPQEWRRPRFVQNPLDPQMVSWFKSRGISTTTLEKRKISYGRAFFSRHEEARPCIMFPYFLGSDVINVKHRDSKKCFQSERGCEPIFYCIDDISEECTIIVEAEMDKLSMDEAGLSNCIGIPYTPAPKTPNYEDCFEYLVSAEQMLNKVGKFVLAFSNTEAGRRLEEEIARRLGKERCWRVQWPEGFKDANEVLSKDGPEALKSAIDAARPFPIKGIFEAMDVADRIDSLYDFGLPRGARTGWKTLDEHYTVKEGQWTLVTGIPGHGKSNFLDAMLVNLAANENWKLGVFSPENQPIERHFANIMEKYVDAPFTFGPVDRMTVEQKEKAKLWVQEHFFVILPDEEEGNWSIDGILALAKVLVFRKGIKGLVIDPWNELDHSRQNGVTETEHISQALTKIRQFARAHSVHVWVVAHPAKLYKDSDGRYPVPTPYDVSGSSHWNNKADNSITVWRNRGGPDEDVADIHIQKIRFKEVGRVGMVSLRYNKASGRFVDDIDQTKRIESLEKGLETPTDELRIFSKGGR